MFRVNHCKGASEGASVDEQVEVDVDTRCRGSGIHDLLLAVFPGAHIRFLVLVLFGDEGRDVGFETTSTNSHNNEADSKDTHGSIRLDDNLRDCREDQDNVPNDGDNTSLSLANIRSFGSHSNALSPLNGLVSAPVLIGNPCTK